MQTHMVTKAAQYAHDYYYAISRGYKALPPLADGTEQYVNAAVPGAKPITGFGERITSGVILNGMVWPNGAVYIPAAAGVQPSIASLSANDTLAGTGIQILDVHYLDHLLVPKVESVNMNGLAAVLMTATDVRWIQKFRAKQVGSGGGAAGAITATFGGNNLQYMAVGDIVSRSSMFMVPAGKVLFVHDAFGGASSGAAAAQVHIEFVATEEEEHQATAQGLFFPKTEVALQDGSASMPFHNPEKFNEGTIVGMMFTTDKAALVTGTWFGWLEDA